MKMSNLQRTTIIGWFMPAVLIAQAQASEHVTIIANPGPFASIEQAAFAENKVNFWDSDLTDDDACTECFAATELRTYLAACLQIADINRIALRTPDALPETGHVFVLGNRRSNPLIETLAKQCDMATDESYRILAHSDHKRTVCVIEGKSRVGTLYGVYDYLTRLGMRFYGLSETGTVYPYKKVAPIKQLDVIENPAFTIRGFYVWQDRGNKDLFLWIARNRLNLWTSAEKDIPYLKKLGLQLAIGAHDVLPNFLDPASEYPYDSELIEGDKEKPADPYTPSTESKGDTNGDGKLTYFEAHPEWYGLYEGKRIDDVSGWGERRRNYCSTNDDATTELAKNFTQGLIDGVWRNADIINFWMVDGHKLWCQCDKCKDISYTDRLLSITYKVNKHVQRARAEGRLARRVHLGTLAYHDTVEPPTQPLPADFDYENCSVTFYPILRCYVHTIDDPNCTEFNTRYSKQIRKWARRENYKGNLCIGEYYNVSVYVSLPTLYTRTMQHDVQWYRAQTARGMHYMHTPTTDWGTWTLNQYLWASLLWDPDIDVSSLLDDYFQRFYPTTTKSTRQFYNHLEDAYSNISTFKYTIPRHLAKIEPDSPIFPNKHLHYKTDHSEAINDAPSLVEMMDSMRLARHALENSLSQCTGIHERARLLADQVRFDYGEAMMLFYFHTIKTLMLERENNEAATKTEFAKAEREAKRLQKVGANITESYIGSPKNGLAATGGIIHLYNNLKKRYNP